MNRRERIRAIDLYRGIAVILMIAAHATDAWLGDRWRQGELWYALDITFGFVAPAFLFLSGLALMASRSRTHSSRGFTPRLPNPSAAPPRASSSELRINRIGCLRGGGVLPSRHRRHRRHACIADTPPSPHPPIPPSPPRRLAATLALAYWLQTPVLSLRQLVWVQRPEDLARLFDSNILHVVAIGGAAVLLVRRLVTPACARLVFAALALVAFIAAPYVWSSTISAHAPLPLRALVSPQPPATFPLLPFIGYLLAGAATLGLVADGTWRRAARAAVLGGAMIGAGLLLDRFIGAHPPHDDFWHGSMQHSAVRLGGVMLGLAVSMVAARRLPARTTVLERIGRRSLAIYLIHLIIIYGSPMTMGSRQWFGGALARTLDPLATLVAFALVTLLTSAAALAWPRLGELYPRTTRSLWLGWWLVFAALFLAIP